MFCDNSAFSQHQVAVWTVGALPDAPQEQHKKSLSCVCVLCRGQAPLRECGLQSKCWQHISSQHYAKGSCNGSCWCSGLQRVSSQLTVPWPQVLQTQHTCTHMPHKPHRVALKDARYKKMRTNPSPLACLSALQPLKPSSSCVASAGCLSVVPVLPLLLTTPRCCVMRPARLHLSPRRWSPPPRGCSTRTLCKARGLSQSQATRWVVGRLCVDNSMGGCIWGCCREATAQQQFCGRCNLAGHQLCSPSTGIVAGICTSHTQGASCAYTKATRNFVHTCVIHTCAGSGQLCCHDPSGPHL